MKDYLKWAMQAFNAVFSLFLAASFIAWDLRVLFNPTSYRIAISTIVFYVLIKRYLYKKL